MREECNEISSLYYLQREEIVATALSFSRKITAFALLEELSELHAVFSYSLSELNTVNDDKLILISHLIVNKIAEFIDDMSEYGIDHESLDTFLILLDRFQKVRDKHLMLVAEERVSKE